MKTPIRLTSGFFTVGTWTLLSRILGFVRDLLFAAILGAGPVAEAFLIAFSLPNMFRRLFAEGAFNMAFVPMISRKLESGDDADLFAGDAMSAMILVLTLLVAMAQAAMPFLVLAMASGFLGDERLDIAVLFGRIVFPYVLFISLAALLSGALNAAGRFAAAAAAPSLLNVFFICALIIAFSSGWDTGLTLAFTVPLAGIAQLALVWVAASRAGFAIRLRLPRLSPDIRRLCVIAAPAALAGGVVQVNLLIGRQVASYFDGAVAWLNYADRLYQLPLGVVGIAVGVVLLPDLSRRLAREDAAGARESFNRAAEASLLLALPAAAALAVAAIPIISVLFERGAFRLHDTLMTAQALVIYAAGLPAFVLQKLYQPLYFARSDTRTPFLFALASMLLNAAIAIGFASQVGFLAAAWGTTIAGWAMIAMLWLGSRSFGSTSRFDVRSRRTLPRILLATILFAAALAISWRALEPWFFQPLLRYLALTVLVIEGLAIYGILLVALGAYRVADILRFATSMKGGERH